MKHFILFILLPLSFLSFSLSAQTSAKTQVWIDATTSFGFLDVAPFKLGFGGGVQFSFNKSINTKSSVGLHLGASKMGNYNRVYGEHSYDVLPNGFQSINQNIKLQAFRFIEMGLHVKYRPSLESPWSWSIATNASLLMQPVGQEYNRYDINLRQPQISETEYVSGFVLRTSVNSNSLDQKDFSNYDISAEATLYYDITKGCALRASFRQGTRNLIKPTVSADGDAKHFLSMVTVGFSARLR